MKTEEAALIEAWNRQAPDGLALSLGALVRRAYPAARDFCEQIAAPEEDHDLRGHVKRTVIEGALLRLPVRFPGLVVRSATNSTRSQNHRELLVDQFVVTLSHIEHVRAPLPEAGFRDTLAAPQAGFFPEFDPWAADPRGNFYAVVVHGSPRPTDLAPSFLNIVFPLPGGQHGLGIDLYTRFPSLRPKASKGFQFGLPMPELEDLDISEEGAEGGA